MRSFKNTGGSSIPFKREKRFYNYDKLGITFITTGDDTLSGIIFLENTKIKTVDGLILGRVRLINITNKIEGDSMLSKEKCYYLNNKNKYGFSEKYSRRVSKRAILSQISYCYRHHKIFKDRKNKTLEIRIGS